MLLSSFFVAWCCGKSSHDERNYGKDMETGGLADIKLILAVELVVWRTMNVSQQVGDVHSLPLLLFLVQCSSPGRLWKAERPLSGH